MTFLTAARAARAALSGFCRIPASVVTVILLILSAFSISCGNGSGTSSAAPDHLAYVTLPSQGSVLLLQINGGTGVVTVGGQTPQVMNTSPNGLALLPSKNFLYTANSRANTISVFSVANN